MEEKITFSVSRGSLLFNLQKVGKSILNKNAVPVYGYILFDIQGDILNLTGSSTEIQVESYVNLLMVDGAMTFCVDKSIIDILKTLPEQPVELEVLKTTENDGSVKIKIELRHSTGNIVISGTDASDYEKMKEVEGKTFVIPVNKLNRGLSMTKKFAGTDPLRPVQNAVYFDLLPDEVVFVATDNGYISRFKDKSIKCKDCESFILGIPAVDILLQLTGGVEGVDVDVVRSKTSVSFSFSGLKMTSRLTEGRYPKYNTVFPSDNDNKMKIGSKQLSAVISRLLTAANPQTGLMKLVGETDKSILFTMDEFTGKSAKEILPAGCNRDITIGFGGYDMQNILSVISGDAVVLFSTPDRVILVQPEKNEEDCELTLLVMPRMLDA